MTSDSAEPDQSNQPRYSISREPSDTFSQAAAELASAYDLHWAATVRSVLLRWPTLTTASAEDAAQEAFVRWLERFHPVMRDDAGGIRLPIICHLPENTPGWLRRTALNVASENYRKQRRTNPTEPSQLADRAGLDDSIEEHHERLVGSEFEAEVQLALARLARRNPVDARLLSLAADGWSTDRLANEFADHAGRPRSPQWVHTRLHRARGRFAGELAKTQRPWKDEA